MNLETQNPKPETRNPKPKYTYAEVSDKIDSIVLGKTPKGWFVGIAIALSFLLLLTFAVGWLFLWGVGVWGVNIPVGWGLAIVNFVWWIGIGHAGTLISAILLLLHQNWRTSINRFAEAMTLFAVGCAGMFPLLHLGRPWNFYWLFPYPNTMGMWPQFRSPLMWDVFAVNTYLTVSLLFWFVGLLPDLATLRDTAKEKWRRMIYGVLSLGWRGSAKHWQRYQSAYILLAGLATPLVLSVHTVVSFDFAIGIVPGWHTTIFPPYFVAGAIYSGFAMVLTLAIPLRRWYKLKDFITERHLDNMAKVMLGTGLIVAYGYLMEGFMTWYGMNSFEQYMATNRFTGPYRGVYWSLLACNLVIPQLLWSRRIRHNTIALFAIALVVNIGMWLERFVIVVTSLARDFTPSAWEMYYPTKWDWFTYLGTFGFFFTCFILFVRVLPVIASAEMREEVWHHGVEKTEDAAA